MRELTLDECDRAQGGGLGMDVIKWAAAQFADWVARRAYAEVGVAGPGGNETDNGGTSYGIGVCNTFGCTADFVRDEDPLGALGSSRRGPSMLI